MGKEPKAVDIWLSHYSASDETQEETFERCLMPESDFPCGDPILKPIPVHHIHNQK